MTWAVAQATSIAGFSATSTSVTFGSSVAVGNLVVVNISYYTVGNSAAPTVTDNAAGGSNTYIQAVGGTSTPYGVYTYYCIVARGGAFTVKAQFAAAAYAAVGISEYSFTSGTLSITTDSATGTSTSPLSGNVTFSNTKALITGAVAVATATGTVTQLGNFAIAYQVPYVSDRTFGLFGVNFLNATTSPQDPGITFGNSISWCAAGVAFQSSGDGLVPLLNNFFF